MADKRICVIGGGPSGMSTLFNFAKFDTMPDVVCYEKQATWGGLWNTSWRTGVDEYGEPNHASMYFKLWTNGFREMLELPDYTFEDHFGKVTPSFVPREAVRDFLVGRWTRKANRDLKSFIEFNTVVRWVKYNDEKQNYTVTVENLKSRETKEETFSHVIVAVGIYSFPYIPEVEGMNNFNGRIIHSHDFRNAAEFNGQKVLLIGASFSGEDIGLQLIKYDAKNIYLSYKDKPKSATCLIPKGIEEKTLVVKVDANKAYFFDWTEVEVDSIIMCTGYRNHFPFLESRLRIPEKTSFYPSGLYSGTLFYKEGNNTLFYVGVENQLYTFIYIEALANWTVRYIMGTLADEPKPFEEMDTDSKAWVERAGKIVSETDVLNFQAILIDTLVERSGLDMELTKQKPLIEKWFRARMDEKYGLMNYRDNCNYTSVYTGNTGVKHKRFMENFDDSLEGYLNAE